MVLGLDDMEGKLGFSILTSPPMVLDETEEGLVSPFVKTVVGHFVIHGEAGEAPAQTLDISDSGNRDRFQRLPERGPAGKDLAPALEGEFYAHDIDALARFRLEGDTLELHIQGSYGRSAWTLEPLSEDVIAFSYKGRIPWRGVLNLRRDAGRVTGFALTSRRTRNLTFERVA
jgi:hypothetical protein